MKNETIILLVVAGAVAFYLYSQSKKAPAATAQNPNAANQTTTDKIIQQGIDIAKEVGGDALDKVAAYAGGF